MSIVCRRLCFSDVWVPKFAHGRNPIPFCFIGSANARWIKDAKVQQWLPLPDHDISSPSFLFGFYWLNMAPVISSSFFIHLVVAWFFPKPAKRWQLPLLFDDSLFSHMTKCVGSSAWILSFCGPLATNYASVLWLCNNHELLIV